MSSSRWFAKGVSMLAPSLEKASSGGTDRPRAVATAAAAPAPPATRSTRERLSATFGRQHEALSPRVLRRTLADLQGVVDARVSEVEGGRRAKALADWYARATPEERRDCWLLMSEQFGPDPKKIQAAREHYEAAQGSADEGAAEIRLRRAFVSPRTRLLQRFAAFPEGLRFLVDLRAELLPHLKGDKRLLALDAELETLFSTWFDVAFLELRRISWDSPASLIEKLIKYEAVHDIRSWADVKNRLDSDRRCYGFFHPRLDGEPLIFVEVALMDEMADSITPLLDEAAAPADLAKATTAIFYSISNTQTGLKGVSFGDSLIKRVVETLKHEFPRLKCFATLSPIPGLRAWMQKNAPAQLLAALEDPRQLDAKSPQRAQALAWAARYLGREQQEGKPLDPVARFHLGNGARIERLNWAGDPSAKGLKQSFGLMVNYLYDLKRLDKHREMLAKGQVPMAKQVESLVPS
jgi:malonyl-CoA decarboxylase